MRKAIRRVLALVLVVLTILLQVTAAYAEDGAAPTDNGSGIGDVDVLTGKGPNGDNEMNGGGRYMSNKYRSNYYLDIEELGIMDMISGGGSFLANLLFALDRLIVHLSAVVFYQCNSFRLAELLEGTMDNVQKSLKEEIFNVLLPFAVIALGVFFVQALVKHNGQAIVGQAVSFFAVMLLATLLTTQTAKVVNVIDDLTMGVQQGLINAVYNIGSGKPESGGNSYAAEVAGTMWDTLVHKPWITLNFEGDESRAEALLSLKPHDEKRTLIIAEQIAKDGNTLFTKDKPAGQIGMLLLYTVPLVLKCGLYICIGGLQLAFRVLTVILALFGIIILFLALIPQLGGMSLVGSWCRKILSIQINIIVLALVLSFIMLLDKVMYDKIPAWGWLLVLAVQTIICVAVFLMRNQIFGLTKTISKAVATPQVTLRNVERGMSKSGGGIYTSAQKGGDMVETFARQKISHQTERIQNRLEAWAGSTITAREDQSPVRRHNYSTAAVLSPEPVLAEPAMPKLYMAARQSSFPEQAVDTGATSRRTYRYSVAPPAPSAAVQEPAHVAAVVLPRAAEHHPANLDGPMAPPTAHSYHRVYSPQPSPPASAAEMAAPAVPHPRYRVYRHNPTPPTATACNCLHSHPYGWAQYAAPEHRAGSPGMPAPHDHRKCA